MWKTSSLLFFIFLLSACDKDASEIMPRETGIGQITQNQSSSIPEISTATKATETSKSTESNRIDSFKERGYKVEEKHVFTRNFEGIGELTVTPVRKFGNDKDFPISLIATGGKKDMVLTPSREDGHAMFSSFEAISFKDIDDYSLKSGYTDIIVITDFVTGAGPDGAKPFSDVFIFKNDTWGNFVEDTLLEKRIRDSADSRTLTIKPLIPILS